jgi:hypothetical protein
MPDGDALMTNFLRLRETAAHLNASSESMNTLFRCVEKALIEANIGLEVWVKEGGITLGFARHTHNWHLLIRRPRELEEGEGGEQAYLLTNATRMERMAALQQLPQLIGALQEAVDSMLVTIEEAKRLIVYP